MNWDSSYNNAIAMAIIALIGPYVIRKHREAHETAKRQMKDGWLKWLVTHEFSWRRHPKQGNQAVVGKGAARSFGERK